MERNKALLFLVVLTLPAFAGCNVKDWYNQNGTVSISLDIPSGDGTLIGSFRSIKTLIYGVSIQQAGGVEPKHFSYGNEPLVLDLVQESKEGGRVKLTEWKTNLRATERVAIRAVVVEAIDASGKVIEVCRLSDKPERFPCFYQPENAALVYGSSKTERPFAPPRGGTVDVGFPVMVKFATIGRVSEYFLQTDPTKIRIENHR